MDATVQAAVVTTDGYVYLRQRESERYCNL